MVVVELLQLNTAIYYTVVINLKLRYQCYKSLSLINIIDYKLHC
jgi:hypothetical protein